jgi:hypothetical protein
MFNFITENANAFYSSLLDFDYTQPSRWVPTKPSNFRASTYQTTIVPLAIRQ